MRSDSAVRHNEHVRIWSSSGGVAQGIANAQAQDLQRKHELQMQREAEQYALELARIQAQSKTTQAPTAPTAPFWESGNAFLAGCAPGFEKADQPSTQTDIEVVGLLACIGFLHGVTDGMILGTSFANGATNTTSPAPWCMPPTATAIQVGRVLVKYIRAHPETAHESPSVLALYAFRDAFPCAPITAK